MSEWVPQVVKLEKIERHPQADTLEISTVLGGYTCIFKEGRFKEGDLAAYVPVDSIVSDNPEFDWLKDKKRIKPIRLRGIFSLGILATPPLDSKEGDSIVDHYGLTKHVYDEEKEDLTGENEHGPSGYVFPYYDIDALRRYQFLLKENEDVVLTEKIEGCNAAFLHDGERLWVKSRNAFKKEDETNRWWKAAKRYNLTEKLSKFPGKVFFAELYGQVVGFPYDCKVDGNTRHNKLRFFDILDPKALTFSDWDRTEEIVRSLDLETAPVLFKGPWTKDLWSMADGKSSIGDHIREGFIVRPAKERIDHHQGRVILKLKGEEYLLKKK